MQTLQDLVPVIRNLGRREGVRWSNGYRTQVSTYAELSGTIGAAAAHLQRLGIHKGERVFIWAENRMEWVALFWACVARGVVAVPVDFRFSEDLVRRIQREAAPKWVVDEAALDELGRLPKIATVEMASVSTDDIVEIVYTSGTTGEPKGVVHRHRNICANLRPFQAEIDKYKKWARPFQPIRILNLLPLSHMFGQSMGVFIPVLLGGSAVFTPEMHPGKLLQIVRENKVSVLVSVPRILENLKNEVERRFALPSPVQSIALRWWRYRKVHFAFGLKFWAFVAGGARVDPELEEFWARLGFLVVQGYGLTEASPVVAVNHPFNAKRGSLGKIVPGQDVVIAADGEILVRGESVTTTEGGWLRTGDLGEIDAEGRLYYRGRKKEVIVTPDGLNVYPEDVERVLNLMPEVRESVVIGVDHVHAVLILKTAVADVDAIIRAANERLEAHQRIREWSIWPEDDFPRTASTLKIKRGEVAAQLKTAVGKEKPAAYLSAMSSLERVELLAQLEEKQGRDLNEEEFARIKTRDELDKWLETAPSPAPARAMPSFRGRSVGTLFQTLIGIPVFRHYLPLTVEGLENLRELEPPVIFASNHTSHLDTPAIFTALPFRWRRLLAPAMAKDAFRPYFEPNGYPRKEVWRTGLGYFLARILYNAYPMPQEMSGAKRALEYTGELVKREYCPLVYPEGARTPDGEMHQFRPGIGMMAINLGVPVVPVYLEGLYEVYSIHDDWPKPGPVRVVIGRPLQFSHETYEEAAQRVRRAVEDLSREIDSSPG